VTRLVRAELLKLMTTRILLWFGLLILGLVTLIVSVTAGNNSTDELAQTAHQRDLLTASAISALVALILGIVVTAGEYAHGTVNQTFLVTPVRSRVIGAKLVAAALVGLGLALVAEVGAYALAAIWLAGKSAPSHLASRDTLQLFVGTLIAGAVAAAIGVGLGAVLRRQTGAIVLALVWLLVGEPLLAIGGVQPYAPGHTIAAVAVNAGRGSGELLHFWPAILLGLLYATVLALLGTWLVERSDVT
jgi:ABC-2 type transport system permease protein